MVHVYNSRCGRLKQEDCKFEARLGNLVKLLEEEEEDEEREGREEDENYLGLALQRIRIVDFIANELRVSVLYT